MPRSSSPSATGPIHYPATVMAKPRRRDVGASSSLPLSSQRHRAGAVARGASCAARTKPLCKASGFTIRETSKRLPARRESGGSGPNTQSWSVRASRLRREGLGLSRSPGLALRDCGRPRASGLRTLSLSVMVEDKVVWTDNLHAPVPRFWSEMLAALRRALPHA